MTRTEEMEKAKAFKRLGRHSFILVAVIACAVLLPGNDDAGMVQLESTGPLIGMDEDAEFPCLSQLVKPGDRLYVYSDGVFEVQLKETGEMWAFNDFLAFMARSSDGSRSKMDELLEYDYQLQGSDEFGDDFSIIEVAW